MRSAPDALAVRWEGARATVELQPLATPTDRGFFASAAARGVLLYALVAIPLTLGEMLGLLSESTPAWTVLGVVLLGPFLEAAIRWRRANARLTVEVEPESIRLVHHLGGFHVVTETLPLECLRRVEHDGVTLRFVLDDRVISEPLPALDADARDWLAEVVLEARAATAEFWRGQLAHAASEAEVRALTDGVSRPS